LAQHRLDPAEGLRCHQPRLGRRHGRPLGAIAQRPPRAPSLIHRQQPRVGDDEAGQLEALELAALVLVPDGGPRFLGEVTRPLDAKPFSQQSHHHAVAPPLDEARPRLALTCARTLEQPGEDEVADHSPL
jgi:hypothetical protein